MLRNLLKKAPRSWKLSAVKLAEGVMSSSIKSAVKQQNLDQLMKRLIEIVPDISEQYTTHKLATPYSLFNVRALHAFQISLVQKTFELLNIKQNEPVTIVDIGDSAGTHLQYLNNLHGNIRSLSVNLDAEAVSKIKNKGLEAIEARAEDLHMYNIDPDIFMLFETLEHLHSPLQLLQSLSEVDCKAFIITVPYVSKTRVALKYIREGREEIVSSEAVHVFELSPTDLRLLFQFAGWRVLHDDIYYQYPKFHPLSASKPIWKNLDFEGFYGAVLVHDKKWKNLYH
jgi:hypothetical protein